MVEKKEDKKKSRKLKKHHILIFILFLFLIAGIFLRFRSSSKSQLRLKIEYLQAKGYPVSLKELDESYSIPDGVENAADFILNAVSNYIEPNDSRLKDTPDWKTLSIQGKLLSDDVMKQAVSYLNDNQKSLDSLHKAGTLKYCRYPVNLSAGQTLKMVDKLKTMMLLGIEAVVHAENGDSQTSADSLICGFNIADSLSDVPLTICQIGRMVLVENNIAALEHIINSKDFNDEQLAQLSKTLADKQRLSGISYGFTGELCNAINQFEDITTSNNLFRDQPLSQRLFYSAYRGVGLMESDGVIYLDILDKYIKAGKLPLEKRLDANKQIQAEYNNISSIHVQLKAAPPNYSKFFADELVSISRLRVAQAALAVQRYRLKNGKLPDSLSSLVPEYLDFVPSDPFDGKEMRYKKLDSGFVIYSIGEDLIDDGGQEEPKDRQQKVPHWDITFTIKK